MGAAIAIILLGLDSLVFTALALQIVKSVTTHIPVIAKTKLAYETDIPSVTVCIPARNEEHALAECLQRIINSTYPKLEIVVLDDSSSDGTSLLIKSFAHAGVRFVRGAALPGGWLGKNHALKELADQANGSYVLFMDVDTRLSPAAIEHMVRTMLSKGVEMLSVIPRRTDGLRTSVLWSPLKYYWELARSRKDAPAASSNAWLIKRSTAQQFFKDNEADIKNAVMPEAYIASQLTSSYAVSIGTPEMGVAYEKKWSSQCETSVRLLHPMIGGRAYRSLLATLGLLTLLTPQILLVSLLWQDASWIHGFAAVLTVLYGLLYAYYAKTVWDKGWYIAFFLWPLIVIQETILVTMSCVMYLQKRVLWKGRPIRSVRPNIR